MFNRANQTEERIMSVSPSGERECSNCHTKAGPSQIYCSKCGHILPDVVIANTNQTSSLRESALPQITEIQIGTGYFHPQAQLFLQAVGGVILPVLIHQGPVIVGRKFEEGDDPRFVDLSELNAQSFGVSRRHVQVELRDNAIYITDLNSTNGSFINRERLIPGKAYLVRNRAALQMGVLILRVLFT